MTISPDTNDTLREQIDAIIESIATKAVAAQDRPGMTFKYAARRRLEHLISQHLVERDIAAQTRLIERFTQLYLLKYGTWDDFTPRKIEWHHVMEVLNLSKDDSLVAELKKQRKEASNE